MSALKPKFLQVEYELVQFLDCHVRAVVYSRLRQWQEYAQAHEWAVDEETGTASFYRLGSELVAETLVKERTLRAILGEFKDKGWLKIDRKGFDPKAWYTFVGAPELSNNSSACVQNVHPAKCKTGTHANAKPGPTQMQNLQVEVINKEIKRTQEERDIFARPDRATRPLENAPLIKNCIEKETIENSSANNAVAARELSQTVKTNTGPVLNDGDAKRAAPAQSTELARSVETKAGKKNNVVTDGTEIWRAYCDAYGKRFKDRDGQPLVPPPSMRNNQSCKRLLETFGKDVSIALCHFLFTSRDSFIVRNNFALLSINDATWQSLYTQMMTGERMTSAKATQQDKHGALGDVAERVLAKWANKSKSI